MTVLPSAVGRVIGCPPPAAHGPAPYPAEAEGGPESEILSLNPAVTRTRVLFARRAAPALAGRA